MNVRLVSVNTCTPTNTIVLHSLPVVVGRSPDADVRLADCWVSRRHCEIGEIEGTLVVRDLGSRHGIFVNGLQVPETHLMPGDKLTVGSTIYRVDYKRRAVMPPLPEAKQEALTSC